jgi:hypothetical protein
VPFLLRLATTADVAVLPPPVPRRWGADERLLRFRVGSAPREDPNAVRAHLPEFLPRERPPPVVQPRPTTHHHPAAAFVSSDAATRALASLPAHTQRLVLAQSMLSRQQRINAEVARRQLWERARWEAWERARRVAADADAEAAAPPSPTEEGEVRLSLPPESLDAASLEARPEHSRDDRVSTASGDAPLEGPDASFAAIARDRAALAAKRAASPARRDAAGLVDLAPEPPLPPIPKLLSLERDDAAAISSAGIDASDPARALLEAANAAAEAVRASAEAERRRERRVFAARDRATHAAEMCRARLREDAAEASRAGKFVKAEHILRQLLAAERAGSARAKGEEEEKEEEENLGVFAKAEAQITRDDEPRRTAPSDVSDSDSPSSAPVLCLLARALLAQRDSSRRAEASELLRLALRVAAPSDAETRYLALKTLSDASAAEDDPDAAVEAESAARDALDVAESRFGPRHARTAEALRTLAARLNRRGACADAEAALRRALAAEEGAGNRAGEKKTRVALAATYRRMGAFERAERIDEATRKKFGRAGWVEGGGRGERG